MDRRIKMLTATYEVGHACSMADLQTVTYKITATKSICINKFAFYSNTNKNSDKINLIHMYTYIIEFDLI